MPQSLAKIIVHTVFSTKDRAHFSAISHSAKNYTDTSAAS